MKTYKELQDDIEFEKTLDDLVEFKLISKAQRRKIALRMKRLVKTASFKKKVERSKKKIANFAKQKVKAAKLAKQKVLDNINYAQSRSENHSIKNVVSNLIKIFN